MGRSLCVSVILATVAAGVACDRVGGGDPTGPRQRSIDELAGSYKGVALGDPRSEAIGVFGRPSSTRDPAHPSNADGWPISQKNPPGYITNPEFSDYDADGRRHPRHRDL